MFKTHSFSRPAVKAKKKKIRFFFFKEYETQRFGFGLPQRVVSAQPGRGFQLQDECGCGKHSILGSSEITGSLAPELPLQKQRPFEKQPSRRAPRGPAAAF